MRHVQALRLSALTGFSVLYFLRRPADALFPMVWAEDGLFNIPQALEHGWRSLFIPVNGYLIVPSKVLTLSSLSVSGIFYPEVAYGLTFAATLMVLVILTSDLVAIPSLKVLPLIIALLPYDPEVFATPLYIFWWTSLLLVVPLLAPKHPPSLSWPRQIKLIVLVIVGALSSPLGIVLWPLMLFRACLIQTKAEYILLGAWTGLVALQLSFSSSSLNLSNAINTGAIPKFLGNYVLYDGWFAQDNGITYLVFAGLAGLSFYLAWTAVKQTDIQRFYLAASLIAAFGSMIAALTRLGFTPDPMIGGPRYFFFPYIFLSIFFLVAIQSCKTIGIKLGCIVILAMACILTWMADGSQFYRLHEPLSWRQQLHHCLKTDEPYHLRFHSDGRLQSAWVIALTPEQCRQIVDSGFLATFYNLDTDKLDLGQLK